MNIWINEDNFFRRKPKRLSPTRLKLLTTLHHHLEESGYAPTIRELAASLDYASHSSVYAHLDVLREGGFLDYQPGRARTWRVTPKGKHAVEERAA